MIVQATEEAIAEAAARIRRGELVAFPTETVYGLGANALDTEAVARIFDAKGRPLGNPLIVHVADPEMARSLVFEWPSLADTLATHFWPGPLTLVLRKGAAVPNLVTAGLDSVGIRIPRNAVALALIRAAGVPVAAPSANRFTEISPTTAEHVAEGMGKHAGMILDGGPTEVGIESTVVSLRRFPPVILRPGMISQQALEQVTGIPWGHTEQKWQKDGVAEAPGQHPKHYAPRTPFFVLDAGSPLPGGQGKLLTLPPDPDAYAHELYAALHAADRERWDWIAVRKPPGEPAWAGILDRLQRASRH